MSQNRRNYNEAQIRELMESLKSNTHLITRPNSIAGILHKIQGFRDYMNPELQKSIFNRAVTVFD